MKFKKKRNYDDSKVREFGIEFTKDVLGLILESHPNKYAIDLIEPDNYEFGVEMERGGWKGNYWENDYSLISELPYRTVNIPIRKRKYWYKYVDGEWVVNENKHLFIRTNKDFTQSLLIRPEVIKDPDKIIFTQFMPNNSKEMEDWMCFKEEDIETFTLNDGNWERNNN